MFSQVCTGVLPVVESSAPGRLCPAADRLRQQKKRARSPAAAEQERPSVTDGLGASWPAL